MNCNGIKSSTKKAELLALIDLRKPDIVLGCESKLDSTIPSYSVFPSTYDILRKDRTSHGGEFLLVFVKTSSQPKKFTSMCTIVRSLLPL